jgi:hypothetical protein
MYSLKSGNSLSPRSQTIDGFSAACPTGLNSEWACGVETSIDLPGLFPIKSAVDLIIEVPDSLAGKEIEFLLGDASLTGKFDSGLQSLFIKFNNSTISDELVVRLLGASNTETTAEEKLIRPIWGFAKPQY